MMTPERKAIVDSLVNQLNQTPYPDSIEIGTPAKGGALKCYGNADDPEGFKKRIDAMIDVKGYAASKLPVLAGKE